MYLPPLLTMDQSSFGIFFIWCQVISWYNPDTVPCKLICNYFFVMCHACGCWLHRADNFWPKGKDGLQCHNMRHEREYAVCHIGMIGVPSVCLLLLSSPVGNIWYSKSTANLHRVGMIIIEIWINLPQFCANSGVEYTNCLAVVNKLGA